MDRIHIRDLMLRCVIGVYPEERRDKQDLVINVILEGDFRTAGRTDRIEDAIDYKTIKKGVIRVVEASRFRLLERLAAAIADECLRDRRVRAVTVTLDKPGALRFARSVAVEITRRRNTKKRTADEPGAA